MEDLFLTLFKSIISGGPLFVGLAIAVWYFKVSDEKKAGLIKTLVDSHDTERQAMMNEYKQRIATLEQHVRECEENHAGMLLRISRLDKLLAETNDHLAK